MAATGQDLMAAGNPANGEIAPLEVVSDKRLAMRSAAARSARTTNCLVCSTM